MTAVECPHGVLDGDQPRRDDGRPRCPLCRREASLRERHPGHPHWDPRLAAAGDIDRREEDDDE